MKTDREPRFNPNWKVKVGLFLSQLALLAGCGPRNSNRPTETEPISTTPPATQTVDTPVSPSPEVSYTPTLSKTPTPKIENTPTPFLNAEFVPAAFPDFPEGAEVIEINTKSAGGETDTYPLKTDGFIPLAKDGKTLSVEVTTDGATETVVPHPEKLWSKNAAGEYVEVVYSKDKSTGGYAVYVDKNGDPVLKMLTEFPDAGEGNAWVAAYDNNEFNPDGSKNPDYMSLSVLRINKITGRIIQQIKIAYGADTEITVDQQTGIILVDGVPFEKAGKVVYGAKKLAREIAAGIPEDIYSVGSKDGVTYGYDKNGNETWKVEGGKWVATYPALPEDFKNNHADITVEKQAGASWMVFDKKDHALLGYYSEKDKIWNFPEAGQTFTLYEKFDNLDEIGSVVGTVVLDENDDSIKPDPSGLWFNDNGDMEYFITSRLGETLADIGLDGLTIAGWKVEKMVLKPGTVDEKMVYRAFLKTVYFWNGRKYFLTTEVRYQFVRFQGEKGDLVVVTPENLQELFPLGGRIELWLRYVPDENNNTNVSGHARSQLPEIERKFLWGNFGDVHLTLDELEDKFIGKETQVELPYTDAYTQGLRTQE